MGQVQTSLHQGHPPLTSGDRAGAGVYAIMLLRWNLCCIRYNEVMSHVSRGGEELGTVFARFIKERAELERDYAKNMRKLVNKYTDKTTESKKARETTQAKGFRWVLES